MLQVLKKRLNEHPKYMTVLFEHPEHMLKIRGNELFTILR